MPRSDAFPVSFLLLFVSISIALPKLTTAGCYQRRLCCKGRDLTCFAFEDDTLAVYQTEPLTAPTTVKTTTAPAVSTSTETTPSPLPAEARGERRKEFMTDTNEILPEKSAKPSSWHVHVDSGGGGPRRSDLWHQSSQLYSFLDALHSSRRLAHLKLKPEKKDEDKKEPWLEDPTETGSGMTPAGQTEGTIATLKPDPVTEPMVNDTEIQYKTPLKYKVYYGKSFQPDPGEDRIEFEGKHPVLQYAILNDHVPYSTLRLQPVGLLTLNERCYCDEVCKSLDDCCRDYDYVCPARDCETSEWGEWTPCLADKDSLASCRGETKRTRTVVRPTEHGGQPCPELVEYRVCEDPVCRHQLQTEVALLLPYKHGRARVPGYNRKLYFDHPKTLTLLEQMEPYITVFDISWQNPTCSVEAVEKTFRAGQRVCVECQPAAQLPKGNRCSGHGMNGERTFWSWVGVKQCFGIWERIQRTNSSTCPSSKSQYPNFIFV